MAIILKAGPTASNARFEVGTAKDYPERDFDIVTLSTVCTTWAT
jgi:hypothetical protein